MRATEIVDGSAVADVGGSGDDAGAGLGAICGRGAGGFAVLQVVDDDVGAGVGEGERNLAAKAAAGAGDEHSLPFECHMLNIGRGWGVRKSGVV